MESKKGEVGELRSLLRTPEVQRDPRRYLQAVQKVIACMTLGIDVSKLFSEMIMAGATVDLVQKKLVYLYLTNYAESNSELALLTVNTLCKDCLDRNPMIRGLSLRAMCSLRVTDILEYVKNPLSSGLKDRSAYVRKTAVMGILKLFYSAPEFVKEQNYVDVLYQLLRDKDPQVVSNAISSLNEMLAGEGGMVVNTKITHYLLNRLRDFNEWGQCQILELLRRYQPSSDEDLFDILNVLDDRLKHANSGVVLGTISLFLHLTNDLTDLQEDVYSRIHTPLLTLLGSGSSELAYTCLKHVQLLLARQPDLWTKDYHDFYCRYNDPPYLKVKKVELLTEVCATNNAKDIINELGEYATDVNAQVARESIRAIGHIALKLVTRADICVDKLLSLLSMDIDYVTSETLVITTNILRKFDNMVEVVLPKLPSSFDSISDPEGRAALLWILGEYGESLAQTPYLLEEAVDHVVEEPSSLVKLSLLTAVTKMFFKRPPECQEMLGRLLEHSIDEESDMDVRDRGMLYYRLLRQDIGLAKKVVSGQSSRLVIQKNTVIPRLSLFTEFNSLSVMYGVLSHNFISSDPPYTRGQPTNQSGAEVDYLELLKTPIEPSSTQALRSSLATIEIPRPHVSGTPPVILLNPKPVMSAGEFEQRWIKMTSACEHELTLDQVPHPKDMERVLAARFVMTMASSSNSEQVIKYFFYGQNVSTFDLFLMEVNVYTNPPSLKFNLKCDNLGQAPDFIKHFLQTLVGQEWLSSN
ncbi:uncharacterized protein LOC135339670 [Halichondria panicea]|uniref:uncharacterized protein LOC135339670 n=1 Tax=Halichondria panicea TaxID=6063 RepID=UPI00312B5760